MGRKQIKKSKKKTIKMKWFSVLFVLSMWSFLGAALAAESQSNGDDSGDLSSIISKSLFEKLLKHRGDGICNGSFYTYEAFIEASKSFSSFGTTGDIDTRKREVSAFLGQTSFETAGSYPKAIFPAYCLVEQFDKSGTNCVNPHYPCNSSTDYYGRGAIQMGYNQDYWEVGKYFGLDLINYPDLVSTDPVLAFKTAFWYWMIPRWPRPSCHDVMTGKWTPSEDDKKAGRLPGYGVISNILNGGIACGKGQPTQELKDRTAFYLKYCKALGVSPGENLDCYNQEQYPGVGVCGVQGFGAVCCPRGQCCSMFGFCGSSYRDCYTLCQGQCRGGSGGGGDGTNVLLPKDI